MVVIHQDADLYATLLEPGEGVAHRLAGGRGAWVQVVRGELTMNGEVLHAGDGVSISGAGEIRLEAQAATEALLFDMGP